MGIVADLLFLAFGLMLIVICAKRGLILTLIKFLKMVFSIVAANAFGGMFGSFFGEKFLNKPIRDAVYKQVSDYYSKTTGGMTSESAMELLPNYLKNDAAVQAELGAIESTGEEMINRVTDTISNAISSVVCGIVGFVLVFAFVMLALSVLYVIIKRFRSLFKEFGMVDSIGGGLIGFVFAYMLLLFVSSILKFFCGNMPVYQDSMIVKYLGESTLLDAIKILDVQNLMN